MNILVVDDSKAMRMIVIRHLRQAGYDNHEFKEAQNGKEALQVFENFRPDLVLSDWNMPEMSGFDLLLALKEKWVGMKFGFVTSESTPEMQQKAFENGALFLIAKPFTVEAFQNALKDIIV